jgi:hypothetical protein
MKLRPRLAAALLALAACGGDDDGETVAEPSAISSTCTPPADCLPIVSLVNIGVCCSDTLRCGFDLTPIASARPMYPELGSVFEVDPDKPCWPRANLFLEHPSPNTERIQVAGGDDVLITPTCQGRLFTTTPLPGCCTPNNTCGYDTHLARNTFHELARASEAAFSEPECLTAAALNAELRANDLAAWAYVPAASGTCDYEALDAMLR